MKARKLYQQLSAAIQAWENCCENNNTEWEQIWYDRIIAAVKETMPSGSGFDSGTSIDLDRSNGEKLVFNTSFHHMDQHGGYDGWTEHTVRVKPSMLFGIDMTISGRDRNEIKELIHSDFFLVLTETYTWPDEK